MSPPQRPPMLCLWGPPRWVRPGAPDLVFAPERRFQLLALLALHGPRGIERDRAAALLWPDHPQAEARRNLRKVLHRAHALVPEVDADDHRLTWAPPTDVDAFELALAQGRCAEAMEILPVLAPSAPLQGLTEGPAADRDAALDEWFGAQRRRLLERWQASMLSALHAPGRSAAERGALAQRLLDEDPLHEEAMRVLIGLELAAGRTAAAARLYRDHARRLVEWGIEPSRALRDLVEAAVPSAPSRSAPSVVSELPAVGAAVPPARPGAGDATTATADLVGRRVELAEAQALLAEPGLRLLTVLGPGGVGKSRFARELVRRSGEAPAASARPGGALWIDLQDLEDLPSVVGRMAQRFGVSVPDPARAAVQLARGVGDRPALVVLDNAEHLVDALRPLLQALLAAAPQITVLVTSRVRLGLADETVLPLSGLAVPDADSRDLDAGRSFDAVQLFEARARAARRDFSLARDWSAVLAIVDAVGGLPLALELAASWVRLLPTAAVAADLQASLELLQRGPDRTSEPARGEHASMQRVLEGSWALLAPAEQAALEGLSVFEGGADRAAAGAVADCPLALAASLGDKGLLATDERGRFVLHPLVAAFAAARRQADPARDAQLRDRHAAWFARRAEALAPHATGDAGRLVEGVADELPDLRRAWREAIAARHLERIAAMTRSLWAFYEFRTRQAEGVAEMWPALAAVADAAESSDRGDRGAALLARSRLAHGLSMLLHRSGRNAEALDLARTAAEAAAACGDVEAQVGCLLNTGMCLMSADQVPAAIPWFERAIAVAAERRDARCLAWARGNLGVAFSYLDRVPDARSMLEQALQGCREAGDLYNVAVQLHNLAVLDFDEGRWDDVVAHLAAARALAERCGLIEVQLWGATAHARLLRHRGQHAAARDEYRRALVLSQRAGSSLFELTARMGVAAIDLAGGDATALDGLQGVIRDALAIGAPSYALLACGLAADHLAARGDLAAAMGLWKMTLATPMIDPHRRRQLEDRVQAAGPALAALPAMSLDDAVRLVLALRPESAAPGGLSAA